MGPSKRGGTAGSRDGCAAIIFHSFICSVIERLVRLSDHHYMMQESDGARRNKATRLLQFYRK